jgi:8-oxo-dGTP pyrophosphatase MutT (NUDIX family)
MTNFGVGSPDIRPQARSERNPEHLREINRSIASLMILSGDGKLLMGRKDPKKGGVYPNVWHIPGGGINEGESPVDAARREGLEEVGIDFTDVELVPIPYVGHDETVKSLPSGEKVWVKMTFHRFGAQLDKPAAEIALRPNSDLVELRWFGPGELAEVEQIPGGKEFFIQAGYIHKAEA